MDASSNNKLSREIVPISSASKGISCGGTYADEALNAIILNKELVLINARRLLLVLDNYIPLKNV